MNVPLIEMPRAAAKLAFREYRDAVRAQHREDDLALMRGYRELARGNRIVDVEAAMRFAGLKENGQPRLAICRADSEHCYFSSGHHAGGREAVVFSRREFRWSWRMSKVNDVVFPRSVFGPELFTRRSLKAVVPSIPPGLRPKASLAGFHILWEAEWETVPRDPMLLRHINGHLYAVLAHWDLTELEMAVLKRRVTP